MKQIYEGEASEKSSMLRPRYVMTHRSRNWINLAPVQDCDFALHSNWGKVFAFNKLLYAAVLKLN